MQFNDTKESVAERTASTNYEDGPSYDPDTAEVRLVKNVLNNLLEDSFYESEEESLDGVREAFDECASTNPEFVLKLAKYTRQEEGLRQVPQLLIVLAANHEATQPYVRDYATGVMSRADEPLEALAMQVQLFGKSIPNSLAKGIEDALHNFNEYQFAKWDRPSREFQYRDLLNLVHPKPRDAERETVFRKIALGDLDDHPEVDPLKQEDTWEDELSDDTDSVSGTISVSNESNAHEIEREGHTVSVGATGSAGRVNVNVSGLVGSEIAEVETSAGTKTLDEDGVVSFTPSATATRMDYSVKVKNPAETWREQLQENEDGYSMPIFARVRNVRNMLEAGLSGEEIFGDECGPPVTDEWVRNSKILPFRFYQAYKAVRGDPNVPTDEYALEWLEDAIELSAENVPDVFDDSLTVVDTSGSMTGLGLSERSELTPMEIGSLFGAVMAERSSDVGAFADHFEMLNLDPRDTVMTNMENISNAGPGGGTRGHLVPKSLRDSGEQYDKVIIFTDLQMWGGNFEAAWESYRDEVSPNVSLYLVDLASYGDLVTPEGTADVYNISGWSSNVLDFIASMERVDEMVASIEAVEP